MSSQARNSIDEMNTLFSFDHLDKAVQIHLQKVYATLALGWLSAALGSMVVVYGVFQYGWLAFLGSIACLLYLLFVRPNGQNNGSRMAVLMLFGFFSGMGLGPIIMISLQVNPTIVPTAFFITAGIFFSFTMAALFNKNRSFLYLGGTLMSLLIGLLVMNIANIFVKSVLIWRIELYLGLVVFCLLILFDTQLIIEKRRLGDTDYIWSSELKDAIEDWDVEMILDIINNYPDIFKFNTDFSIDPIYCAIKGNCLEIVKILVGKGADVNRRGFLSRTYLHFAAKIDSLEMIEFFIDSGVSINDIDIYGNTALMVAAQCGNTICTEKLIKRGANPRESNHSLLNCLHYACMAANYDNINFLLKLGLSIHSIDVDGRTPLHCAAGSGNLGALKCLVENGANVNAVDKRGKSGLHYAVQICKNDISQWEVLHYLAENRASLYVIDKSQKRAIDYSESGDECRNIFIESEHTRRATSTDSAVSICDVCEAEPISRALALCGHTMCMRCSWEVDLCPFCNSSARERQLVLM